MFQPVLPLTGYVGWRFLERTQAAQETAFSESSQMLRETDNFRAKIGTITSAKDLVANRELLSVALGAFGLDDDIDNKFFIEKILSEGTTATDSLANRLSDGSYAALSSAFGFGDPGGPFNRLSGFADRIIAKYETKQFQRAVGEQNNDLRLALSIHDSLADITAQSRSENAQWFSMMGSASLRTVFETALGLPSSIAQIDLDQQLTAFKNRSLQVFGTDNISDFNDPTQQESLLRMFLVRSEANAANSLSSGSIALTLLQNIR